MSDIRPFTIDISDAALVDLKERLHRTRWPDQELVDDWSQGIPVSYVQEVCEYWANEYNWRSRQAELNRHSHFLTEIDGVDIHLIHCPSPNPDALPLIITHGWPGSFVEFLKVIGPLVDPAAHGGDAEDAFHLVLPSMPGYAFSGKPPETGWNTAKFADVWADLMSRLGYERFVAQGGDWGSMVTTFLGANHADHCAAIHLNMSVVRPTGEPTTPQARHALERIEHYQRFDGAYRLQQATRPQTLGYGLADSPSGQAAWILEKFWSWTDCDGHPENVLSRDEMLDNIMLYWLNNTATSSARLYWESSAMDRPDVSVPAGFSVFPWEIFPPVREWCETKYSDINFWREHDKGGHFAAFERPDVYVADVRDCFRQVR